MPVLDPHLANVMEWEGSDKDFPHGPMYWKNKTKDGKEIDCVAVGSTDGKERNDIVGTVTKALKDDEDLKGANGSTAKGKFGDHLTPNLTRLPTQTPSVVDNTEKVGEQAPEDVPVVVQEGEVIPATRPEPMKFHTAVEGVETLSLNEKAGNLGNGTANENGPHATATANLLDPNVKIGEEKELEDAHTHHEAANKSDPKTGGGTEEADNAHTAKA